MLLEETEYRRLQRQARRHGTTVASLVREALRAAWDEEPAASPERKLAAVRAAVRHAFPIGEIGQVLDEIERGRRDLSL